MGRVPLLLRRPRRLPRGDRAAGVKAVVLRGPSDVGVEDVADPAPPRADATRSSASTPRPSAAPTSARSTGTSRASSTGRSWATSSRARSSRSGADVVDDPARRPRREHEPRRGRNVRRLPRGPGHAMLRPRALRLLGRLPAARRRPGRARPRPPRRHGALAAPRRGLGRGGGLPRRHPADRLRRGRPRRRRSASDLVVRRRPAAPSG